MIWETIDNKGYFCKQYVQSWEILPRKSGNVLEKAIGALAQQLKKIEYI